MKIRKARLEDLEIIMEAYDYARQFMQRTGNGNQWTDGYPSRELIVKDITDRNSYVCVDPVFGITGVFYFRIGEDRTYARIEEGHWLNEEPYGVVHRIATNGKVRGVADYCLRWCMNKSGNMRIDTHRDNRVMQHILEKNGYTACGIIYIEDGTERIAFQKMKNEEYKDTNRMKVLLVNGSPHSKGCTFTALSEVASALEESGIETELFQLGLKPIAGCRGCGHCHQTGKCIIDTDVVNPFIEKVDQYDGFVFGSPVHYAAASGAITSFMDRAFFAAGRKMAYKPGAVLVSCRRAGSTAALDQLTKYLTISQMPVVSSQYWTMVHGAEADDVRQDAEGMQTMRVLGRNMAWLLRCIEAGKAAGVALPEKEERVWTNFIS